MLGTYINGEKSVELPIMNSVNSARRSLDFKIGQGGKFFLCK